MAAGLGFKTFTTGEVLTSADTNGYLMQGILVFDDATARDAAITSPQEGQFAYLKDTNVTTYYTGSAWANVDTTGMNNPMTTTADMIYSSSGSTPARLGIGTVGQVLTVNSGATAPEWATPASGGGKVLQVVFASSTTTKSSTSTTYADTDITATITPSSASSKVLVMVVHAAAGKNGDASNGLLQVKLMRGATEISNSGDVFGNNNVSHPNFSELTMVELDSPATTSATTYKTQYRSPNGGSGGAVINNYYNTSGQAKSTITLMEIGA
jgi:hypothetical protein